MNITVLFNNIFNILDKIDIYDASEITLFDVDHVNTHSSNLSKTVQDHFSRRGFKKWKKNCIAIIQIYLIYTHMCNIKTNDISLLKKKSVLKWLIIQN